MKSHSNGAASLSCNFLPRSLLPLALVLGLFAVPQLVLGQSVGRVIYEQEIDTEEPLVRPYIIAYAGLGDPIDKAYDVVFSDNYLRVGGGFGMDFGNFGAEVFMRQGSVSQSHVLKRFDNREEVRNLSFSTMEVQFRLQMLPRVSGFTLPVGIGAGLVNVTVDRGYPGIFDRFGTGNFYVSPFVGARYAVTSSLTFSVEAEYAMSHVRFGRNEAWQNQHGGSTRAFIPHTDGSFWDTVGGDESNTFNTGGLLVAVRAIIYIPTYRGK